jgi:hypothetical protein
MIPCAKPGGRSAGGRRHLPVHAASPRERLAVVRAAMIGQTETIAQFHDGLGPVLLQLNYSLNWTDRQLRGRPNIVS